MLAEFPYAVRIRVPMYSNVNAIDYVHDKNVKRHIFL